MDENNFYEYSEDTELNTQEPTETTQNIPVVSRAEKNDPKKFIIVMCLICTLIGAVVGGVTAGIIVSSRDVSETVQSANADNANETTTVPSAVTTEKQTPAVVETTVEQTVEQTVESTTIQSGTYTSSDDKPSDDKTYTAKEIYENNVESVVGIQVSSGYSTGYGTGFIISEEGYIVTNFHVVDGASTYIVTLYDDSKYDAKLVGYEDSNDIAVLKIEPKRTIQSVIYGESSSLDVGDPVYVIGNPLGDLTYTLTDGLVSALNRLIETTEDGMLINMFQTNAAINSGNSGGPVFDEHGYVVGIASAKYAAASIEGLSFCIPIDDVRSMIDEIINIGYVSGKPSIGVSVCDREIISYGFVQASRSIDGAKIVAIGTGTAAEEYGLQVGDIITAVGVVSISSVSELKTALSSYRSGDVTFLTVNRNGDEMSIHLILDEYEPSDARTNYSYVYDL